MGGSGEVSSGLYRGIAPGVSFVCAKILNRNGKGTLSNLINGLEWIREIRKEYEIRIVNISIEIGKYTPISGEQDLTRLYDIINYLWEEGVMVLIAAGNAGPKAQTISSIADGNACICVACHDGDYVGRNGYNCSKFSGRGPGRHYHATQNYNPMRKPDLVAPGSDITSCNAFFSRKGQSYYTIKSGTSMAAPQISGACALYMQKYPDATNNEIRTKLLLSAKDLEEPWYIQGAGMLQIDDFLNI